ncbi:MAG: KTSC domain-containing protein [Deltaproteobacteria bacterium]|nr:KTSC domain-containing protein [Deltaproteobacteria bacterium]MBW2259112.1 KTSC domain-containing protein [Deltaproteobacteria bacterium]
MMVDVDSSNLKAIGYDKGVVEIEFRSGRVYRYTGVNFEIFRALRSAPSKGKYFWRHIRCRSHDCSGGMIPYPYYRVR